VRRERKEFTEEDHEYLGEEEGIEEAKEGVNRMEIDGWEGTGYWVLFFSIGGQALRQVLGTNWGKGWGQTLQLGRV
jgi:hypothetical protein